MRKEFIRGVWILLPRRIHPKSLVINVIFLRAVGMHAEPLSALSQGSHTPDQSAAPPDTPRWRPEAGPASRQTGLPGYSAPANCPDCVQAMRGKGSRYRDTYGFAARSVRQESGST